MADAGFTSFLIHRATVERPETTPGAALKPSTSYTEVATDVPCRVKPVKADSKQSVGGYVTDSDHKAYFEADAGVLEGDRLTVGGTRYLVRGVEAPVDGAAVHHLTAHLKRQGVQP